MERKDGRVECRKRPDFSVLERAEGSSVLVCTSRCVSRRSVMRDRAHLSAERVKLVDDIERALQGMLEAEGYALRDDADAEEFGVETAFLTPERISVAAIVDDGDGKSAIDADSTCSFCSVHVFSELRESCQRARHSAGADA